MTASCKFKIKIKAELEDAYGLNKGAGSRGGRKWGGGPFGPQPLPPQPGLALQLV